MTTHLFGKSPDPAKNLRNLMDRPRIIRGLGVHDVFTGLVAQSCGCEAVFIGGFGTSASLLGLPDLGLLTLEEMAAAVRRMAARLEIPVIADADTGYGDLQNVVRTVWEFERAGAAGLLLEDQTTPKRCGHFDDKRVIPCEEMILKIKAAVHARQNPDFVLFARTDARQSSGLEEAIQRVIRYCEAGADVAFIEAPQSVWELEEIPRRVPFPLFANMLSGGATPILPAEKLQRLGYKFVVCPVESLMVCGAAIRELCMVFLEEGRVDNRVSGSMSFDQIKQLLHVDEFLDLRCLLKKSD